MIKSPDGKDRITGGHLADVHADIIARGNTVGHADTIRARAAEIIEGVGAFAIDPETRVVATGPAAAEAKMLIEYLTPALGYDLELRTASEPAEGIISLQIDPELKLPKLRIAKRLLQKKLGMRYLLDVIALNGDQVKGSHGRLLEDPADGPLVILSDPAFVSDKLQMTDIKQLILDVLARQG